MDDRRFLLYGATGYTGELIARHAAAIGMKPILAGRSPLKVTTLARELGFEGRVFSLTDRPAVMSALSDVGVLLNCAGPFSQTYRPLVEACLARRAHYLDITGDIDEFEGVLALDAQARDAGVMLLPSVGFDVVPSDCLAAHLKRRLPSATSLALAFDGVGGVSRGTLLSTIEAAGRPGMIRRDGQLTHVPSAYRTRTIDFGNHTRTCVTIPWGDVFTSYHSTGIPNIEVYIAQPMLARLSLLLVRYAGPALASDAGQAILRRLVLTRAAGPTAAQRQRGYSLLWGEATDDAGMRAIARMRTPHSYTLTAMSSLAVAGRVIAGDVHPGYQTPASAYGADFALELPGVTRSDDLLTID